MNKDMFGRLVTDIEKDFAKHVATVKFNEPGLYVLRWQEPKTWINAVEYVIRLNTLLVWGDLGEAAYQWGSNISIDFLSGCSLDYFRQKCQASEFGRGYEYWWSEKATERLEWQFGEQEVDDETRRVYLANKNDLFAACQSKESWNEWLGDPFDSEVREKLFGDDWWEYGGIGIDAHPRCVMHLHGLKMAHKQLSVKEEKPA